MAQSDDGALSTAQVAEAAGVHRDTLLRWLRQGLIPEPSRDRHGWRLFSKPDVDLVLQFAKSGASIAREATDADDYHRELDRLEAFDWSFPEAKTSYLTHGLHPYPAKFIPQIPNALIQELSSVGETVADVFCGSGTTLVEALLLKRHAVGLDANPLACLISQAKTTRLRDGDDDCLREVVTKAAALGDRLALENGPLLFEAAPFRSSGWRPPNPAVQFWFPIHVIEELAEILSWCRSLPTESARDIALTAFSSVLVAVSKQDSDTRYTRREKDIPPGETLRRFSRSASEALRSAMELTEATEGRFHCRVVHGDALNPPDIGEAHLIVSSPPYPNAYSYHLYHMTRMVWLGMDQPKFKTAEIGSHRKYSRRGPNGARAETFAAEMLRVFEWLRGVLRPNRFACFVIGDSIINGVKVDNAAILSHASERAGFREARRFRRRIKESRKAFNPAYGKIKTESILVLQRI